MLKINKGHGYQQTIIRTDYWTYVFRFAKTCQGIHEWTVEMHGPYRSDDDDFASDSRWDTCSTFWEVSCLINKIELKLTDNKQKPAQMREFTSLNGYEAKRKGRTVQLRNNWEKIKVPIMKKLLQIKFSDPKLKALLCKIHYDITEENTWNDTYWGICNGFGQNVLGNLLMEVRQEHWKKDAEINNLIK